jgi:integrase/recombinase XerD
VTFEELIYRYQQHLLNLHRNPSTLAGIRVCTQDFALHCQQVYGCNNVQSVQPSFFGSYLSGLEQDRKLAPTTVYGRQRIVRTLFSWATLQGYVLVDPGRNVHRNCPDMLPRGAPTLEQVRALLQAPDLTVWGQRDRALLEFMYGTGLRLGEVVALDLVHLRLGERLLHVQHGKGKRERMIPIGAHLALILQSYLDEIRPKLLKRKTCEALWLSRRGNRIAKSVIVERIFNYSAGLGLKISAHRLRHAFATHLLTAGAPLIAVQRLLGHVNLKMTSRYTHLVPIDLQDSILRTHPRGKRKKTRAKREL